MFFNRATDNTVFITRTGRTPSDALGKFESPIFFVFADPVLNVTQRFCGKNLVKDFDAEKRVRDTVAGNKEASNFASKAQRH